MSLSRDELESCLLSDPFNSERRAQYAELLLACAEHDAALAQFEILSKQSPNDAGVRIGLSLALLGIGRESDALQSYAAARRLPGFVPDETLEAHLTKS